MPVAQIDASYEKFPSYQIVSGGDWSSPAILSDEELAFIRDAGGREAYADALIAHRIDPDEETAGRLDRMAKHLERVGIPVPAAPTDEELNQ